MENRLDARVEWLESTVTGLNTVPGQVRKLSSQFVQLRKDVKEDISTARGELRAEMAGMRDELRTEMAGMRDELRSEMVAMRDGLRAEMADMRTELRGEMSDMHRDLARAILSSEERVVGQMRMLHEDVMTSLGLAREGRAPTRTGAPKTPRRGRR